MIPPSRATLALLCAAAFATPTTAQQTLPLRQSSLEWSARDPGFRLELDSTFDARWLGGGATLPRWDLEGCWAYFQYALDPKPRVGGVADESGMMHEMGGDR